MKASDLRTGNYYSQFGYIKMATWPVIRDLVVATEEQLWCKPIPLTEEWLLKFIWQLESKNKFHINSYFSLDVYGHLYYQNDYTGLNINYVHQLQNLYYALTGQELTLNEIK